MRGLDHDQMVHRLESAPSRLAVDELSPGMCDTTLHALGPRRKLGGLLPVRRRSPARRQIVAKVDRLSVAMPPAIGAAVREAAARRGASVSTWLVAAAVHRLRNELLGAALDRWEAEQGPFTDQELIHVLKGVIAPRTRSNHDLTSTSPRAITSRFPLRPVATPS